MQLFLAPLTVENVTSTPGMARLSDGAFRNGSMLIPTSHRVTTVGKMTVSTLVVVVDSPAPACDRLGRRRRPHQNSIVSLIAAVVGFPCPVSVSRRQEVSVPDGSTPVGEVVIVA